MRKNIDPFLYGVEELDLHGENRYSALYLIKTFIEDSVKMGREKVLIIHGKGSGIIKSVTYDYLKKCKYVESYSTSNYNDGQTIEILKKR